MTLTLVIACVPWLPTTTSNRTGRFCSTTPLGTSGAATRRERLAAPGRAGPAGGASAVTHAWLRAEGPVAGTASTVMHSRPARVTRSRTPILAVSPGGKSAPSDRWMALTPRFCSTRPASNMALTTTPLAVASEWFVMAIS